MRKGLKMFKSFLFVPLLAMVLVGCDPIDPDDTTPDVIEDVSILEGWQDNLDSVYDPVVTDGVLHMNFDKSGATWGSAKKSLAAVSQDLDGMETLGIELKMADYAGGGVMSILLKIEFNDATANPAREVKFLFSAEKKSYEWDVSEYDLTDALQMLMFIDFNCGTTSGDAIFSILSFSATSAVTNPIAVPIPVNVVKNVYASGDPYDVNKNFYDGGDFVYEIETSDGVTTISYSKYGPEWASAYMLAEGVENFAYLNAKIKGPAEKTAMLKIEGGEGAAIEHVVTFTGEIQDVTLPFGTKATKTGEQKFLIFAEQGSAAVSAGVIELSLLEYSSTALVEVVDHNNYYTGMNPWDKEWHLSKYVDDGKGHYDVVGNKVSWADESPGSWDTVKALLDTTYRVAFTKFEATITAGQPMKLIVKVDAPVNVEQILEFAAGDLTKTASLDLSAKSDADLRSVSEVILFPLFDGGNPGTGELTINTAKFHAPRSAAIGEDAASLIIGPTNYNIVLGNDGTEISWDTKGDWEAFGLPLDGAVDYSAVTKVEVEFKARSISELMVKLNDSQEYKLAVSADDGEVVKVTANVTTPIDAANKPFMIFFPDGGSAAAGHLTIVSLKLVV